MLAPHRRGRTQRNLQAAPGQPDRPDFRADRQVLYLLHRRVAEEVSGIEAGARVRDRQRRHVQGRPALRVQPMQGCRPVSPLTLERAVAILATPIAWAGRTRQVDRMLARAVIAFLALPGIVAFLVPVIWLR